MTLVKFFRAALIALALPAVGLILPSSAQATAMPQEASPTVASTCLNTISGVAADPAIPGMGSKASIDLSTGAITTNPEVKLGSEALGLATDGSRSYSVRSSGPDGSPYVDAFIIVTAANGNSTEYAIPQRFLYPIKSGAFNPANGLYYMSDATTLYAFNTKTGKWIGAVGYNFPGAGSISAGGDFAFDRSGNFYRLSNNYFDNGRSTSLFRVEADRVPTSAGPTVMTFDTSILSVNLPAENTGLAFGGDGYLYVLTSNGATGALIALDPNTGRQVRYLSGPAFAQISDLASCAFPSTVRLQADVVERFAPGDTFELRIDDGGTMDGRTAFTADGQGTGIQKESVGPALVLVMPGRTFNISERGLGSTRLSNYQTDYRCQDVDTGAVISSGRGSKSTVTVPEGIGKTISCVFSNKLVVPELTLRNTALSTDTNPGSVFYYAVDASNTGSADFTDANPAQFTIDLSDVLDDATYNNDARDAILDGKQLKISTWIPKGETFSYIYSITIDNSTTNRGDNVMVNRVIGGINCARDSQRPECATSTAVNKPKPEIKPEPGPQIDSVTVTGQGNPGHNKERLAAGNSSETQDLAVTGTNVFVPLGLAGFLLLIGAFLLVFTRRKTNP